METARPEIIVSRHQWMADPIHQDSSAVGAMSAPPTMVPRLHVGQERRGSGPSFVVEMIGNGNRLGVALGLDRPNEANSLMANVNMPLGEGLLVGVSAGVGLCRDAWV